jgi:hypothetical protein
MLFLEGLSLPALRVHVVKRPVNASRERAIAVGRDGEAKHAGGQLVIVREVEFHPKKGSEGRVRKGRGVHAASMKKLPADRAFSAPHRNRG